MLENFKKLGLSDKVLQVLKRKGFEEPTPIQKLVIPAVLAGNSDIVGQAQTGTGKTAAFGLPIIELLNEKSKTVQTLILTPTRELAIQVSEEIISLKGNKILNIAPIYGGQSINLQFRSLRKGIDIVVGTPGRIIDHIKRGTLKLDKISYLILDEADEMLDMGFIDDIKIILQKTPGTKTTMLFSATMPHEIITIAKKYMHKYEMFKIVENQLTVAQTDQIYYEVSEQDKFEGLCRIIDIEEDFYGLVFCKTKLKVDSVSNHLIERSYAADALHGDISQNMREKILKKFKTKQINILVATDVAARGIDIHELTHVINYSLPQDPKSYIHRIGRTGRAGKEGIAITFITSEEYRKLQFIKHKTKTDIRKARIPKVKDIIEARKRKIKSELTKIIGLDPKADYIKMAKELLFENSSENILAALLEYFFKDKLDQNKYTEIKDSFIDNKGKTRLFVTHGRQEGLTAGKLSQFIQKKCDIPNWKIKDIKILDKFSFVTLPFHEAEILLSHFKKSKRGKELFITKAKEKAKNRKNRSFAK